MRPASRTSTPKYMDVSQGRTCGNCTECAIDDIYIPSELGLCRELDKPVNIRRITTCKCWGAREEAV